MGTGVRDPSIKKEISMGTYETNSDSLKIVGLKDNFTKFLQEDYAWDHVPGNTKKTEMLSTHMIWE